MGNYAIPKPFNLLRWFSMVSLAALLPVAGAIGFILSWFITEETLQQHAAQTAQFVQNCIDLKNRQAGLGKRVNFPDLPDERNDARRRGISADGLQLLPDVLLASVLTRDGRVVWSTRRELEGRMAAADGDLARAFAGEQVVRHYPVSLAQAEVRPFSVQPREFFIKTSVPLRDARGDVTLVAEIYREPAGLLASIRRSQNLMWGTMAAAGVLLFLSLYGITRAGYTMLQRQQQQLREMDSLAFMGEIASAVAHSLRNPLACIRSSAELALDADYEPVRKNAQDIVNQVDFLSKWVRELLHYTQPVAGEPEPVHLEAVLSDVADSFAPACTRQGIAIQRGWDIRGNTLIEGNTSLVAQALRSILSNGVEAMPQGGELRIRLGRAADRYRLTIADTGIGMTEMQLAMALKPFHTTKRQGLGVGLPMVKRIVERFGGTVTLSSRQGHGTEVRLEFRKWHGKHQHGQHDTGSG